MDDFLWVATHMLNERAVFPENPYWLTATMQTYCLACIVENFPHAQIEDDYDGGFHWESDDAVNCSKCGKTLAYTLTSEGVNAELDLWQDWDWNNPEDCYALARIAGGIQTDQLERLYAVVKVGKNPPTELLEFASE